MNFDNVKKITADFIDGSSSELTDLIVNGVTVWEKPVTIESISLSVDSPVIMTGETATLSALVLDSEGEPVPNVEVSFSSNIPNSTIYHSITNSSGIATMQYMGVANGNTTITSSIDELSDNILIEDCIAHSLPEQSATGTSSADQYFYKQPTWQTNSNYEVEMEVKANSDNSLCLGVRSTDVSSLRVCFGKKYNGVNDSYLSDGQTRTYANFPSYSLSNWIKFRFTFINGAIKGYINDDLVYESSLSSVSLQQVSMNTYIQTWATNRTGYIRNVKVKPIS